MSKIGKAIKGIGAILKNPWLLNHVINDNSVWDKYISKTYAIENGLPELHVRQFSDGFSETLNCFAFLDGGSLPTDLILLKLLAKRFDRGSYFEIGTWRGESVINVADIAEECYTLNLSRNEIIALGLSEKYADLHGFFSKGKENITHLEGNTLTFDFKKLDKKFDLIFIDGDHHYDYVKNDSEKVFEHLIHDHSIVVWHDYAYSPEHLRSEVFAGILDGVPSKYHKHLYHVPNTMCAVFIRGDFETSKFVSPIRPEEVFKVTIESREC